MKTIPYILILLMLTMIVASISITIIKTKSADTKVIYEKENLKIEFVVVSS